MVEGLYGAVGFNVWDLEFAVWSWSLGAKVHGIGSASPVEELRLELI